MPTDQRGTYRFHNATEKEVAAIDHILTKDKKTIAFSDTPQICVIEDGNVTNVLVRDGRRLWVGTAKRNPTSQKVLVDVRTGEIAAREDVNPEFFNHLKSEKYTVTVGGKKTTAPAFKVSKVDIDKPNPEIAFQVALASAMRQRPILIT